MNTHTNYLQHIHTAVDQIEVSIVRKDQVHFDV